MTIIRSLCIAILILCTPVMASDYLLITDNGTSAKMIGIGMIEGFDNSANSLFENPANLGNTLSTSISIYSTTLIDEFEMTNFSISQKTKWGTIAIGQFSGKISDITKTSLTEELGTFGYSDTILKIGYQNTINPSTFYGITLTNYSKEIDTYSASGYDLDLGVKTQWKKGGISLVGKNILGNSVEYSHNQSESLPRQIVLSGQQKFGSIALYLQAKLNGDKGAQKSAGISAHLPFFPQLKITGGYKEFFVLDTLKSGTTLGASLDIGTFSINYAFEKSDYVGFDNKTYFSVSINLNLVEEFRSRQTPKHRLNQ